MNKPAPEPLSLPALEVLSIVAYEQPITLAEISHIRETDSSGVIETLLARATGRRWSSVANTNSAKLFCAVLSVSHSWASIERTMGVLRETRRPRGATKAIKRQDHQRYRPLCRWQTLQGVAAARRASPGQANAGRQRSSSETTGGRGRRNAHHPRSMMLLGFVARTERSREGLG